MEKAQVMETEQVGKSTGNANATPLPLERIVIRGRNYFVFDASTLPLGNVCNHCAFKGQSCYDADLFDFSCHSDSRPDERDVYFVLDV
jgi:hypothetical protein